MASVYALSDSSQRKNFLKNPNFAVIQSTASGTISNSLAVPTASVGYLGETEWWLAASGGTPAYAFSQLNENVTVTGAVGTTAIHLGQRVESRDANKLKSKTVTLSAEISNSLLTSVTWELFNPTTTNDIHGTVAVSTQTLISSGTFTVNATIARYSATIALPVGVSRGLGVRLRVGAQVSGTWVVSRLQLEEGVIATNFSCDDVSVESRKCNRYFERIEGGGNYAASLSGGVAFVANNRVSSETPVSLVDFIEKFAIPIIAFPSNGVARYVHSSGVFSPVTVVANSVNTKNFILSGDTAPVSGYGWLDNVGNINISAHIP